MVELVASNVFSEKQIGYITLGVYLNGNYDLVTMFIEHFRKEIRNQENEPGQCLAIAAAANIGGREIAEALSGPILQALINPKNSDFVKKTACLALCRLYRETPSVIQLEPTFIEGLNQLLFSMNYGVQLSAASLILILLQRYSDKMALVLPTALMQLGKIFFDGTVSPDYLYGRNPAPWLILKYMRILQYKTNWDESETDRITRILDNCLQKTDVSLAAKEVHSNLILLFEAINFIIARQFSNQLMQRSASILGGFLNAKLSNVRYLALESLTRLVQANPSIIPSLDQHRQTLYLALRDPDNSIRRRTLSLLFAVCTKESAEEIVHELLNYLRFADITMREPLCLKIAVMAEQFAEDPAWFVDVVLQLITMAGDECSDGVWHRVIQVVSNVQSLQRYATMTSFGSMCANNPHDRLIALTAQLVGEYIQITDIRPEEVIQELIAKYKIASDISKGIIITALAKIGAKYPPGKQTVLEFIQTLTSSTNIDIQQRAIEYITILNAPPQVMQAVFKPIPPFENKKSSLLRKVMLEQAEEGLEEEDEEDKNEEDPSKFVTQLPTKAAPAAPAAAPAPEPKNNADAMDLLGLGSPAPAPAQPKPVAKPTDFGLGAPATPQNAVTDLLSAAPVTNVPAPLNDKEAIKKHFLANDQGLCFEDANIAVNLSIQVNHPNAILSFNIQNKTGGILTNVGVHIPPVPFLAVQSKPGATQINRGEMTVFQFALRVRQPFIDPPSYTLRYTWSEQSHNEVLDLPFNIFKFTAPFNMDYNNFFARWGQLTSPAQQATASFNPVGDPTNQMKQVMTSVFKVPVLPLQVPPGNVCGAGIINAEGGVLGILCRFFIENGKCNVQIKG
ncbi:Adaptin N terminal region family protein, partial [Trichomonas vaginalis G3]